MKSIFFTADDYGVFPSINEGIKTAVRAGKINSVACLTNHPDSIKNIRELTDISPHVQIGCHLTITSGKPLTAISDIFLDEKHFRSFNNLKISSIEKQSDQLKKELKSQIEVLLDNNIQVHHLSCHHGVFSFTAKLFNVFAQVSSDMKVPIRSVNVQPTAKDNLYRKVLDLLLLENVSSSKRAEIKRFGKEISVYRKVNFPFLISPDSLQSSHYGPPPLIEVADFRVNSLAREKRKNLNEAIEQLLQGNESSSEIMFHLIQDDVYLYEQDDSVDYPGINRKYFDSRVVEMRSLKMFDLKQFDGKIEFGRWNELK